MLIDVRENDYIINIRAGNDDFLREEMVKRKPARVLLLSDSRVYPLYRDKVLKILQGLRVHPFIIEEGEGSKTIESYRSCLSFMSDKAFTRSDVILSLGGGVVGDLAGFLASSYQRGLDLVSVPTSLLAMVDSSVGGKNGINFAGYKNQVGTFYFPSYVHIDTDFLASLDEREVRCGLGEIFKYALLEDEDLFNYLRDTDKLDFERIIKRSLEIKLAYVRSDEKDRGKRNFLNLGHTIGHGIEALHQGEIKHGEAVAIGLVAISRLSYKLGLAQEDLARKLRNAMESYGLRTDYPIKAEDLIPAMAHDKKLMDGRINLILPIEIGRCTSRKMTLDELDQALDLID